jgi:hypothetical protein
MQADIYKNEVSLQKRREGGGTPGKGYIPTPPTEARQVDIFKNEVCKKEEGRRNPWEGIYPDTPTEAMQADIYKNEVCKKRRKGGGTPGKGYIPTPPLKPCRQTSIRMKFAKKEEGSRNPWEGIYPDTPTEAMQTSVRMKSAKKEEGWRNPWEGIYPDTPH